MSLIISVGVTIGGKPSSFVKEAFRAEGESYVTSCFIGFDRQAVEEISYEHIE